MSVIVVGGIRGIGLAISKRFARDGRPVTMAYLSNDQAARAAEEALGGTGQSVRADASDPEQVRALFDAAERLGPVDVVVHSAVIPLLGNALTASLDQFDTAYRTGPRAFLILVQEAARRMTDGGHVVAIGSIASGPRFTPGYGILGPAKCAVDHLVAQLGCELAPRNIRINCIATSTVEGDWVRTHPKGEKLRANLVRQTPAGRTGKEEDVANAVAMICSADADWIVGQKIVADGGMALVL
ncbi:MAG: budC 2 [Gammaproteobacteria bacterium]|jgi:NAD(P)-dependent dehydrogenase (short-subunit alcohol dehydrogenase family)|nr:budC 2 [Gammaproteobacteria bacterium]